MTKEEFVEKLRDNDKKLFEIFSEVTSVSELSVYKSSLLTAKLGLLEIDVSNCVRLLNDLTKKEIKNSYREALINLIIYTISCILMFLVPMLGLIGVFYCLSKSNKYFLNKKDDKQFANDTNELLKRMKITFDNCERFIEARTNPEMIGYDEEEVDIVEIDKVLENVEPVFVEFIEVQIDDRNEENYSLTRRKIQN